MTRYVLKPSTVREAIEDLHDRRVHPHFPTYLGLVKYSEEQGTRRDLRYPYAEYLDENYRVEASSNRNMVVDGKEKPFLTPFTKHRPMWKGDNWQQQVSPKTAGRAEANQGLHKVADIDVDDGTYTLHSDHVEEAFEYLALEEKVPAIPIAVYLYRNNAFEPEDDGDEPELSDLEELFREEYGFQDDEDFNTLFIEDYDLDVTDPFEVYDD